jgi:hypothetical protein
MNKELLEIAKQATAEGWDAFKIMAVMLDYQKEVDAKLVSALGHEDIADKIRNQ